MFLENLKEEANYTLTENGAKTHLSTKNYCLDLFATIGALRGRDKEDILRRFNLTFAEDPLMAMKILFYARDIRGGLGERQVFRTIICDLAKKDPKVVEKNIGYFPKYGRWDDLLCLLDGPCENKVLQMLKWQFNTDWWSHVSGRIKDITLLAKWLPSANTSSKETVRQAKKIINYFRISEKSYRKMLTALRKDIWIVENNLRKKDYTFDYAKTPSRAMFKYQKAFIRNDGERYSKYLDDVNAGEAKMHTGTLYPYDIVHKCLNSYSRYDRNPDFTDETRKSLDTMWDSLEDFTNGSNSLVILDGSGSMYRSSSRSMCPIDVAMSLAIYFAEHTEGEYHNHFITFSSNPKLVEIHGMDIVDKVKFCEEFNDCSNTDLARTFELLLHTAVARHVPQSRMPETLYIISDMEFDCCENADMTNFQYAKKMFEENGYKLPNIVFWNVDSRNEQQPVTMNEQGVVLVSGASPRIFQMVISGDTDPMAYMKSVILSERYAPITC